MAAVTYNVQQELPVVAQADVVVVGGGPGGLGAAVMAARAGAKALLVERYAALGGMASYGEVNPFMGNHVGGESLDAPVYTEWLERMAAYWPRENGERIISKDIAMLAGEDLCLEAGVELLYHHALADVIRAGRTVTELIFLSKSGYVAVRGTQFVDCTGDGDVAARAGCAFELGGPSGHCQPMTLCFKLCQVEPERIPDRETLNRLYDEARSRGEIDCPRENVLRFPWLESDVVHFNTTRVIHKKGTNGVELSEAEVAARQQVRQFLRFFQSHVPGFENARIHSVGHHIGVRETRRVRGLTYLTREAFVEARKCADGIAKCRYPVDIHNPDGSGTELVHMPEGDWYEIPYGCVVAADVDNLTVGGRPISVDHAIHSSMRVMPPAVSVGQAAGLGAATAAARSCRPADLGGAEIRALLKAQGARL